MTLITASSNLVGQVKPVIGYGSSDYAVDGKAHEWKRLGFKLGFNKFSTKGSYEQLVLEEMLEDKKPLSCLVSAKKLVQRGALILTGYSSGHEAVLVAQYAAKEKVVFLTGMSHHILGNISEYVHTIGITHLGAAQRIADFAAKRYGKDPGLVIWRNGCAFSRPLTEELRAQQKANALLNLDYFDLEDSERQTLSPALLERLRRGKYQYLLFTTFFEVAGSTLRQLAQAGLDLPIISNQSWPTRNIENLGAFFSEKKKPIFMIANWLPGAREAKVFENESNKTFGKIFAYDVAMGYDYGVAIASVINGIEGAINPDSFLRSLRKKPCVNNTSSGTMCLAKNGGFAQRQNYFVRYDTGSLVEEK